MLTSRRMADEVANMPRFLHPPSFEVDASIVSHYADVPRERLPWVQLVDTHQEDGEPAVFARFLAFDRDGSRIYVVRGLLAEPLAVVHVAIEVRDRSGGLLELRTTDTRVRLGEMRDQAVTRLESLARLSQNPASVHHRTLVSRRGDLVEAVERASSRRGGRPPVPDETLELVARRYLDLFDRRVRRGIREELARSLSQDLQRPVPIGTVDDWLERARKTGWLERGGRGRAGGLPGPRLIERNRQLKEADDG